MLKLDELSKELKRIASENNHDLDSFEAGAYQVRNYYDTALIEMFGKELGLQISNALIEKAIEHHNKK